MEVEATVTMDEEAHATTAPTDDIEDDPSPPNDPRVRVSVSENGLVTIDYDENGENPSPALLSFWAKKAKGKRPVREISPPVQAVASGGGSNKRELRYVADTKGEEVSAISKMWN